MTDHQAPNPYEAVLTDLRTKRAEIDNAIHVLERLSGLPSVAPLNEAASSIVTVASGGSGGIEETAGMYLGMSIVDAAKKLLGSRKRTMGNVEIANDLRAGGLVFSGMDPANVVGSVLTRRFNNVGDVVKVGRGVWGLKEWYPGRTFKPAGKQPSLVTQDAAEDAETGPTAEELLG